MTPRYEIGKGERSLCPVCGSETEVSNGPDPCWICPDCNFYWEGDFDPLDEIRGNEESDDPLARNRRQQARMAALAVDAAEKAWPGFLSLARELVEEERRLLGEAGPQA